MTALGFYYHTPAMTRNEHIYMPGYLGHFIDSLANNCKQVTCFLHSPRQEEKHLLDYAIKATNVNWVDIGPHASVMKRTLLPRRFTHQLRERRKSLDLLLARGPSPLLPAMVKAAKPLPTALLLVGDYLAGVDDIPQRRWRKELIRVWSTWYQRAQVRAAQHSLTFVNSHRLYEELQPIVPLLRETRTSTLNRGDFYERVDTCKTRPIRLLYTGRLSVSKGLFDIVTAIALLARQGEKLVLDLAGWPEKGEEQIIEQLCDFAHQQNVPSSVNYLGYKSLGVDLFRCYQKADIYIMASVAEGFPRTIWEAMAHSLPVVATRVGSIPAFIEGVAELVEPSQPEQLANAIFRLLCNPELRQAHIRKGITLARRNTLETQTSFMVTEIKDLLR